MALAAYRHLLRATRIAFQEDHHLLHAARSQAQSSFRASSSLLPSDPETAKQIAHAEDVAQILRKNVVQAEKTEQSGEERWRLRIHEDTERGDNASIKTAGKKNTLAEGGGGCGGSSA